nr:VP3 [Gyrovirus galga1]
MQTPRSRRRATTTQSELLTAYEHPTSSSPPAETTSIEIQIGIGSTIITLSLPGYASVRVLTTRSAPADDGGVTGSRRLVDLSHRRPRRTSSPEIYVGFSAKERRQKENLITLREEGPPIKKLRL